MTTKLNIGFENEPASERLGKMQFTKNFIIGTLKKLPEIPGYDLAGSISLSDAQLRTHEVFLLRKGLSKLYDLSDSISHLHVTHHRISMSD